MFVKWSCGCVGFRIENDQAESGALCIVLQACDADDEGHCCRARDMTGKTWELIHPSEIMVLVNSINSLIGDGYRLREVQSLLTKG